MTRPRVVVVGLGDTGILTTIALRRSADVVAISAQPEFVSGQELGLRLARPEAWQRDYRIDYRRFRGLDRARIVHGSATALDTAGRCVHVDLADGSRAEEAYDLVVIATGVTNGFWRHPTLRGAGRHHRRTRYPPPAPGAVQIGRGDRRRRSGGERGRPDRRTVAAHPR